MIIRKPEPIASSEITDRATYLRRREFISAAAAGSALLSTPITRDASGEATLAIDMTRGAVAGIAADVSFDPTQWEPVWIGAGDRLSRALRIHADAPTDVARLVAVSVPVESGVTTGDLGRFRFRPLVTDADLARIRLRDIQLADPHGARIAVTSALPVLTRQPFGVSTSVGQNYPNPFNPETWIPFSVSDTGPVTLTVFAADGSSVRALSLGEVQPGKYQDRSRAAYWDGRNALGELAPSGVYFYRLTSEAGSATGRMVIAK